jgi:hypothetical protein
MIPVPLKHLKIYLIGGMAIALLVCGIFFLGRGFQKPRIIQSPVYSRIEEVRHIRHLELVTYYFESMVDVTHLEKADKVYLLMIVPARVSCYIDLEHMHYLVEDSLVRIQLPEPVIEPPVLDLDSARLFNMNQRYVTASKKSYETVVRNVQLSLGRAKEDVLNRAAANGIREEARRLGEAYFRSLLTGLGFEIEFISQPEQTGTGP